MSAGVPRDLPTSRSIEAGGEGGVIVGNKVEEYDDSPWTREELESVAWHTAEQTGWEECDDVAATL